LLRSVACSTLAFNVSALFSAAAKLSCCIRSVTSASRDCSSSFSRSLQKQQQQQQQQQHHHCCQQQCSSGCSLTSASKGLLQQLPRSMQ
jgi:hypothetical protein